jgi:hypothetical protein
VVSLVLSLAALFAAADLRPETAELARQLKPLRSAKRYTMTATQAQKARDAVLVWLDERMESGVSIDEMNRELVAAGLYSDGPDSPVDGFDPDKHFAGFVGKIRQQPLHKSISDVVAVTYSIRTTTPCGNDDTVVVYTEAAPRKRLLRVNADDRYQHGYRLRDFTFGHPGPAGNRIIGSAWVMSNCTSNWNGNRFRIDSLDATGTLHNAHTSSESVYFGEPMRVTTSGDTVTFDFTGSSRKPDQFTRREAKRYRVSPDGKSARLTLHYKSTP